MFVKVTSIPYAIAYVYKSNFNIQRGFTSKNTIIQMYINKDLVEGDSALCQPEKKTVNRCVTVS